MQATGIYVSQTPQLYPLTIHLKDDDILEFEQILVTKFTNLLQFHGHAVAKLFSALAKL